jgi:maleate isomerase
MGTTIFELHDKPMHGRSGRIGAIIPANNSVIEPEFWSVQPTGVALCATRILARGDLTPKAVVRMEQHVDCAVDELAATGVDVIAYCDMVTTFIMQPGWNEAKIAQMESRSAIAMHSAWTALRDALGALDARRIALGTPYPRTIHALAAPFFASRGYEIVGDATFDIVKMNEVPKVSAHRLANFVDSLSRERADVIVLLATDLPPSAPSLRSNRSLAYRCSRRTRLSCGVHCAA